MTLAVSFLFRILDVNQNDQIIKLSKSQFFTDKNVNDKLNTG